jgi:hypothetical protein
VSGFTGAYYRAMNTVFNPIDWVNKNVISRSVVGRSLCLIDHHSLAPLPFEFA